MNAEALSTELTEMVENHWRSLIRLSAINPQMAGEEVFRFEAQVEQLAAGYPAAHAATIRSFIMELRGKYAEWERNDPTGLRTTLNVTGGGSGTAMAWLVNLETPASVDLGDQLDTFWREILAKGIPNQRAFATQYSQLTAGFQAQIAHLPQPEQDGIMTRAVLRNAEYIQLAQANREGLKSRLGVHTAQPSGGSPIVNQLAHTAAHTAVRATVWQAIGGLFRAFR